MAADRTRDDQWDLEAGERKDPVRGRRAVVSVAFSAEDFATVASGAKTQDQPVSTFIRKAAIRAATGNAVVVEPAWSIQGGGGGAVVTVSGATVGTASRGSEAKRPEQEVAESITE